MRLDWLKFKEFVDSRGVSIQEIESNSSYKLSAIDGGYRVNCYLPKNPSDSTHIDDYESNYKPASNKSPMQKVAQKLDLDFDKLRPCGFSFTATKNTITSYDFLFDNTYKFRGGILFSPNAKMHDFIEIWIIDKDDVLHALTGGLNPANGQPITPQNPWLITKYVPKWVVMPGVPNKVEDVDLSDPVTQGLYMRVSYNSHASATENAEVLMNLLTYEV